MNKVQMPKNLCSIYGQKRLSSVAEARLEMFFEKYKPEIGKNPIFCAPVILQKLRRTTYVWLNAHEASPPKFYLVNADGLFKMIVTD